MRRAQQVATDLPVAFIENASIELERVVEVTASPFPYGRGSVTEPRALASGGYTGAAA